MVVKRPASQMEGDATVDSGSVADGTSSKSARGFGAAEWVAAFRTYESAGKVYGTLSAAARSVGTSPSHFSYHYGVWKRTGQEPRFDFGPGPRLGSDVEKELERFIIVMSDRHMPLTRETVKNKAKLLAEAVGIREEDVGGADWLSRFLTRHPTLAVRIPQQIETSRLVSPTSKNINRYFDNLEASFVLFKEVGGAETVNLKEFLFNMDECAVGMRDARDFVSHARITE